MSRTARTAEPRTDAAAVGSAVRAFALCMLAAVVASGLPLPWSVGALLFTLAALVLGVQGLRLAARARTRGALVVWLSLGLALAGVTLLIQVVRVALWPVQWDYERCREAAITVSAEERCEEDLDADLRQRLTPAGWPTS